MHWSKRIPILTISLLAIAILSVWLYDERQQIVGQALVSANMHQPSQARLQAAVRAFERGGLLNPDLQPQLNIAAAYLFAGRPELALTQLNAVVRAEPANLPAWQLLEQVAAPVDPAAAELASVRQRQLAPPVPMPRS